MNPDHIDQAVEDGTVVMSTTLDTPIHEDVTLYCSVVCTGAVYSDGERISQKDVLDVEGAPFPIDLSFDGRYPQEGEIQRIVEGYNLGGMMRAMFDNRKS